MDKDRFGVPRPFVDGGEGPAGVDRPLVRNQEERLVVELESMISDENAANVEYQRIINMLMRTGFEDQADVVRTIRDQEREHKSKLENILSKVRRETS